MKILLINSVCGIGSTGRICTDLAADFERQGHEVKIAYGRNHVPPQFEKYAVPIGNPLECRLHGIRTRILDEHGFGSKRATGKFLKWVEEYSPDLLWLHNIHGYYINVELLFAWIKKHPHMQVKWTLHDCWAFTGHCAHFTLAGCSQWKQGCVQCSQKKEYPSSLIKDNCAKNYDRKRSAFTGVKNLEIITPSRWLADLVKQSFLKEYPVTVHYNTVDTGNFRPTPSDLKERLGIQDKRVILGVSGIWNERKGLYDFLKLAQMLDENYVIVLVGLSEKQIEKMPELIKGCGSDRGYPESRPDKAVSIRTQNGIAVPAGVENIYREITGMPYRERSHGQASLLCIPRTDSVKELAAMYTMADFFVNPTYEDNFPTVNLEAIACGTYVITYLTGGCAETLEQGGTG